MLYAYATLSDETEVAHSENKLGNGQFLVTVRFERPDEKYTFKVLEVELPTYKILKVHGYTKDEVKGLLGYTRNNCSLILEYSQKGGIANA